MLNPGFVAGSTYYRPKWKPLGLASQQDEDLRFLDNFVGRNILAGVKPLGSAMHECTYNTFFG